jgi:hypothetical protein
MQACVDKDYDLSELDTEVMLHIPPVPVGTLDTAWFTSLSTVTIPDLSEAVAREYVVDSLFTEEIISKFFFDGATTISLTGNMDISIADLSPETGITIQIHALDENNEVINAIRIEEKEMKNKTQQKFLLKIEGEYMSHMEHARGIKITFIFNDLGDFDLGQDDYLLLNNLVLKTGGMKTEL